MKKDSVCIYFNRKLCVAELPKLLSLIKLFNAIGLHQGYLYDML
ncbi:hypothetical protein N473_07270 [Pseudoalteromonas luteoviolacea CPMOR-1]|uniref:Uncharacterized protein n=1 Tax=Pseudoalteromonas luteoviolacea CPMOR-1 TaxID=1365248 RepID=A0A162BTG6_9GAMM|nr:hypothetical protein N473_07270 [Pseudoalteromonas luteoviolacea CPMOR-1]